MEGDRYGLSGESGFGSRGGGLGKEVGAEGKEVGVEGRGGSEEEPGGKRTGVFRPDLLLLVCKFRQKVRC